MGVHILQSLIYGLIVIVIDLASKIYIQSTMQPYESIPIIDNVFHITYVQNRGAAFSILEDKTYILMTVTVIVMLGLIFLLVKIPRDKKLIGFTLSIILGGALGNLIDRLRFGYVVDFLDFRVWPVFNIADCAIVIGFIILSYLLIFDKDLISFLENKGR